ncbi:MAG: hypothetical protein QXT73_00500 [Candidatus Methanomethylicaceae archaeon]
MKIRKPQRGHGAFCLIYGDPGVGKTVSTLLSLPKPILYYELDPKPVERTAWDIVDFEDIEIRHPDNFLDLFYEVSEHASEIIQNFASVVVDPLSYCINVLLLSEIEEESVKAEIFGEKTRKRPLVSMARTDQAGYGSLASLSKRLCHALGRIAIAGKVVVCTALLDQAPKWNRDLSAAPAFAGREFNRDMPAFFDYIGLVTERQGEDGRIIYPPIVHFESDGSFLAKWSGKGTRRSGPLDWKKILRLEEDRPEGQEN